MKITRSFDCETFEEALEFVKHAKTLEALDLNFSMNLQIEERKFKTALHGVQSVPVYVVEISVEADE